MDNDPYQPPGSSLEPPPTRRSAMWKVYFFLITALSITSFPVVFAMEGHGMAEYVALILWVPATAGLFGFVFVRQIVAPEFWRYFFVAYLIFSVAYGWLTNIDFSEGLSPEEDLTYMIIGWALELPGYIGLYLYGRPTDLAWRDHSSAPGA